MIRILTLDERPAHPRAFDTMFEDRKRLFVDLLRWEVPVIDDRFEIDAFDHADAVYVVALDDSGDHQGSLRLLPSMGPHILDTLFAQLCPLDVPIGADVFEITRLCLPTRLGAVSRLAVRNALISVMVDHSLANRITRLTGVVEARFRREILDMGWRAEPLGPAMPFGGAQLGAFAIDVAADTSDRLGWTGVYQADAAALTFVAGPCGSGMIGVEAAS
jgi:N-acyl-L-homoserine lactone synthetase